MDKLEFANYRIDVQFTKSGPTLNRILLYNQLFVIKLFEFLLQSIKLSIFIFVFYNNQLIFQLFIL